MNDRNKKLAVTTVLVLLGGLLLYFVATTLYSWIEERYAAIEKQEKALAEAKGKQEQLRRAKVQLDRWRSISLPSNFDDANNRYQSLLVALLQDHGLYDAAQTPGATSRSTRQGVKVFNVLTYNWKIEGTAPQLVGFLEDFHLLNLPHSIRELKAENKTGEPGGKLAIELKIEALSFANASNREFLPALPDKNVVRMEMLSALTGNPGTGMAFAFSQFGPTGLYGSVVSRAPKGKPGPWPLGPRGLMSGSKVAGYVNGLRDYKRIEGKNPFAGLAPPPVAKNTDLPPELDIIKYLKVTTIAVFTESSGFTVKKVYIRDNARNRLHPLRDESPSNELVIKDANNHDLLRLKVVQILDDTRGIIVEHKDQYFLVAIDESFADALKPERALSEERLKIYKLTPLSGKEPNGKDDKEPPVDSP